MLNLICSQCHNVFRARRASAKFCSPACKQKAHRVKRGQKDTRFAFIDEISIRERVVCKHCQRSFYPQSKGRKPKYCSNSCRQSANKFKQAAAYKFVKAINGAALGWSDYDCYMYVLEQGTDAIEKWATSLGWEYSYTVRRFWQKSEHLWAVQDA